MLVVKDFDKQNVVTDEQIKAAIAKVPVLHLQGLEYIVYDPSRFFQRSYVAPKPINYKVVGQYNQIPKKFICIHRISHVNEFNHVLYHEIGHHVFNQILPSQLRVAWVNDIYPHSSHFVSEYASKNAQEDFCESYSCFYTKFNELAKDSRKLAFIRNCMRCQI
ncbi:hypothetical protein [Pseudoalteromonas sp. MMG022]|uniref:hypothetical protein n=1 Tax=Pseudoalteromonas sp. MMG022 TaxID=2909978 RepID=UPI001F2FFB89|nr:hypothetical protein [Pseudoalteromonas sp. MMG022]MCF6436975.1 hypothetical protein [Pseudoalteromonas sp. MMG022]